MSAERLYHREHEENTRSTELRQATELASGAMVSQIGALRTQLFRWLTMTWLAYPSVACMVLYCTFRSIHFVD